MNLLSQLNRSIHRLQECLHPGRPLARQAGSQGGVVITVALLSMAAASILVLAP